MEGKTILFLRTSSVARAPMYFHLRDKLKLKLLLIHPYDPPAAFYYPDDHEEHPGELVFERWIRHDTNDVESLHDTLHQEGLFEGQTQIDAIISFDEYAVYTAALLSERVGLPRPMPMPSDLIRVTNVKADFRRACAAYRARYLEERKRNGEDSDPSSQLHNRGTLADLHIPMSSVLPMPAFITEDVLQGPSDTNSADDEAIISRLEEHVGRHLVVVRPTKSEEEGAAAPDACAHLSFPLMMKPSPGAGSLLARVCNSTREAAEHALLTWRRLHNFPDRRHYEVYQQANERRTTVLPHIAEVDPSKTNPSMKRSPSDPASSVPGVTPHPNESFSSADGNGFLATPPVENAVAVNSELNISAAAAAAAAAPSFSSVIEILMEEFIGGDEVDVDVCVENNDTIAFCAISDNFNPQPPYFAEVGGLCPSRLPPRAQLALSKLLHGFMHFAREYHRDASADSAIYLNGVLHVEAKYDHQRGRAFLIEVNCRPGSAETNSLITSCFNGMQLGEAAVRCALGLPLSDLINNCFGGEEPHPGASSSLVQQDTSVVESVSQYNRMAAEYLGGRANGFFPCRRFGSSANVYPTRTGTLESMYFDYAPPSWLHKTLTDAPSAITAAPRKLMTVHYSTVSLYPLLAYEENSNCPATQYETEPEHARGPTHMLADPSYDYDSLLAYSLSASPGDCVAPPPERFYLLCWLAAAGPTPTAAIAARDRWVSRLVQTYCQE